MNLFFFFSRSLLPPQATTAGEGSSGCLEWLVKIESESQLGAFEVKFIFIFLLFYGKLKFMYVLL